MFWWSKTWSSDLIIPLLLVMCAFVQKMTKEKNIMNIGHRSKGLYNNITCIIRDVGCILNLEWVVPIQGATLIQYLKWRSQSQHLIYYNKMTTGIMKGLERYPAADLCRHIWWSGYWKTLHFRLPTSPSKRMVLFGSLIYIIQWELLDLPTTLSIYSISIRRSHPHEATPLKTDK